MLGLFAIDDRLSHLAAAMMCVAVLAQGVRTTADLAWPPDTDHYRDLAQSQTIRDGAPLQDPFYRGEANWYNPLLPGIVAAVSYLTGQPVHVSAARAGAYLNLAAPIAFYLLIFRLMGPACALAALAGFLFVIRGPTWATPTYSPWLYASVFAQTFFYLTLAVYSAATTAERRRWPFVLAGVLLGLTFLTHTAPAILAGITIVAITAYRAATRKRTAREAAIELSLIVVPAVCVALPFLWSIVGHYRLHIRNPIPLTWLDPNLPPDDWESLWAQLAPRPFLNTMILVGLAAVCLGHLRRPARSIAAVWFGASVLLFVYGNYLVPRFSALPPTVPAHHFLLYERAAEIPIFGLGVTMTASVVGWLVWRAVRSRFKNIECDRIRQGTFALSIVAIVLVNFPAFLAREDFGPARERARRQFATGELRELVPWIRENSTATDVFLTSETACLSVVGPAGRKCVLAPIFFSNPYVDWNERRVAQQAMWDALTADDCPTFRRHAYGYRVTFVMTVEGRTPQVATDRCGLIPTSFPGTNWRIYRTLRY